MLPIPRIGGANDEDLYVIEVRVHHFGPHPNPKVVSGIHHDNVGLLKLMEAIVEPATGV
jgi:hypothetical protein